MRLIKQIIEKKVEKHNLYSSKKYYIMSIWQFGQALNLSLAVLGKKLNKKDINRMNRAYKKIILSREIKEEEIKHINNFINNHMKIIIDALDKIDDMTKKADTYGEEIERDDLIMINAYEFEGLGD